MVVDFSVLSPASFWCPLPSAQHPEVDRVEHVALAWVDRFGLCANSAERAWLAATSSADFYARFVPTADFDGLAIAVCWVYWGFAFDDRFCDEGPLAADPDAFGQFAERIQQVLDAPPSTPPAEPYAAALDDLGRRMRAYAGPTRAQRFRAAHRDWLAGVWQQVANRAPAGCQIPTSTLPCACCLPVAVPRSL